MISRIGPRRPFKHYIREWMEVRDINQERLAGRLEVESSTISKLLTGRMRMSDRWMSAIADALNLEIHELFLDPDRPSQNELLEGLDEDQKAAVINLVNMMKRTG